MRSLLIYAIFICYGEGLIFFAAASFTDLSLLSGGYDIDEYLDTHQYQDSPWIVSRFPHTENVGGHFVPIINVEYPIKEIAPHLGYINHMQIKNQLGNTFIPSAEDDTLNVLLNAEPVHASSTLFFPNPEYHIEKYSNHVQGSFGGAIPIPKKIGKNEYFDVDDVVF